MENKKYEQMKELDQKLMRATEDEDLESAKNLITQGANVNALDNWRNSALSNAVWKEKIRTMEFLYNYGAKIHAEGGHNPMIQAVFNAKLKSVIWLLDKGLDPNYVLEVTGETMQRNIHKTIRVN